MVTSPTVSFSTCPSARVLVCRKEESVIAGKGKSQKNYHVYDVAINEKTFLRRQWFREILKSLQTWEAMSEIISDDRRTNGALQSHFSRWLSSLIYWFFIKFSFFLEWREAFLGKMKRNEKIFGFSGRDIDFWFMQMHASELMRVLEPMTLALSGVFVFDRAHNCHSCRASVIGEKSHFPTSFHIIHLNWADEHTIQLLSLTNWTD